MTREEAIEVIKQDIPCEHDADLIEALEMAIKALSQEPQCTEHPCLGTLCRYYKEPCTDAVSRQAAIEAVKERITFAKAIRPNGDVFNLFESENAELEKAIANIKKLPSVNAIQHTFNASKDVEQRTNTLGDAINRRASIDALKKHFSDDDGIDTECGAYWHHADVIEVLQGMPPVQPKRQTYTEDELKEFADGISLRLCSLKSAEYWGGKYTEQIAWLEQLYAKV